MGRAEDARPEAARLGLLASTDTGQLEVWVREALDGNPKAVADVKAGGKSSAKAFGYLMGQVMQRSRGAARPPEVERRLREALGL